MSEANEHTDTATANAPTKRSTHQPDAGIAHLETAHLDALAPKARRLLEAMVWQGLPLNRAAEKVNVSVTHRYRLVGSSTFQRALKKEIEVLRTSARPRAIARLQELADQDEAKSAAVQAARFLASEHDDAAQVNVGVGVSIGYVIDLAPVPGSSSAREGAVVDVVAGARNHMSTTGGPALGGRRPPTPPVIDGQAEEG